MGDSCACESVRANLVGEIGYSIFYVAAFISLQPGSVCCQGNHIPESFCHKTIVFIFDCLSNIYILQFLFSPPACWGVNSYTCVGEKSIVSPDFEEAINLYKYMRIYLWTALRIKDFTCGRAI
jgi:hypothetical protein